MNRISRIAAMTAIFAISAGAAFAHDVQSYAGLSEGTIVKLHLAEPASSNRVQTGDSVALVVAEDVSRDGKVIIAKGSPAVGKVQLAGIAGMNGHEGNLKIAAVSVRTVTNEVVPLGGTVSSDGKQRKALAFMASRWIRGDDVTIANDTVFDGHVGLEPVASPSPAAK
jgi:hypothetical protein